MKNILITGFRPFLKAAVNPSQKLAESFSSLYDTLILPVTFEECFEKLNQKLKSKNYDFILMLGQAAGRSHVSLEQVAINFLDSKYPDESGVYRQSQAIEDGGEGAFISPLPLRQWAETLLAKELPVERSLSAGSYICNFLYYNVLNIPQYAQNSLFVHLPYLPEQVIGKNPQPPSMEFEKMRECISAIISLFPH